MTTTELSKLIYSKYGMVTRARNCYLYTKKGIRLTDLFQENGRAILGWHGGSAFTFLKNTLSKGLTGSFICEDKSRLDKAITKLFDNETKNNSRTVFAFSSKAEALKAGLMFSSQNTSVYSPWNQANIDYSKVDSIVMQPPLPWTQTIFLTAVKSSLINANNLSDNKIELSNTISIPFALETAITKSIYNLISEIPLRQEKDWFIYDPVLTKYWTRKGPYLYPKMSEEKYNDFVTHCLECELIINPNYHMPSLIPFGADKGVFTKLKNNPFSF